MAKPNIYLYRDRSISGKSGAFSYITLTGFKYESAVNAITAFSGGGQTSATPLTLQNNRVTTVAVNGDSVLLPPALAGLIISVTNVGASTLAVFPSSATQGGVTGGDAINALSQNSSFSVAVTKSCKFLAAVDGTWNSLLSA